MQRKKKIVIIALILAVICGVFVYVVLANKKDAIVYSEYDLKKEDGKEIVFERQKNSTITKGGGKSEGGYYEDIVIDLAQDEFKINIYHQRNLETKAIQTKKILYDYKAINFDEFHVGDRKFLLSRKGGTKTMGDALASFHPKIGNVYFVYEIYDDKISEYQSLFGYEYDFYVSYTFKTQSAIDNWSNYKEVLKKTITSIEKK